jgi:peptide/nickel transport system ATP-binding protein
MPPLLEARHVTKVFGGGMFGRRATTTAIDDLSLVVNNNPPSITAIVGESGSGKTTLARVLLGLTVPTRGEVFYAGKDVRTLNKVERRQFLRDVQVVFQDPYEVYNPFYKVDHVLDGPIQNFGLASGPAKTRELVDETLRAVGLRPEETLGRYPHQLSGGQRQRLMVARALLVRPKLIIADEPVSMVDASLRATILDNIQSLNREFGISFIYITHDLTTAYQISENIIVLYRGSVAEAGDVEVVVGEPAHPYTRLLIGAVPVPDPTQGWKAHQFVADSGIPAIAGRDHCKFADRCPAIMPMCRESVPPLFQPEAHRAASCFLYREAPKVTSDDISSVFVRQAPDPAAPVRPPEP